MANCVRSLALVLLVLSGLAAAASDTATCRAIEDKLSSIQEGECDQFNWQVDALTPNGHGLLYTDIAPTQNPLSAQRILLIGGIHGDEFSSVTISFKWLQVLTQQLQRNFTWRFIPAANPDGLLAAPGTRQNSHGIDLNRNFPTENWGRESAKYWRKVRQDKRRFPGNKPASEPETQWLLQQIQQFNPDVIIAIHAPYHLLDFDGPPLKPLKMGKLALNQLGVYPGSLGNYGSLCLGKQVVTLELASAGVMPSQSEIKRMWRDLVRWLANNESYQRKKGKSRQYQLNEACQ